jgi:hypothetical protein
MENNIQTIEIKPGTSFEANGRKYTPSETFSIGRFSLVEELEEELIMLSDKRSCHAVMLSAMQKINDYNPGEAYTLMYNKIDSDQRNAKLVHYSLRLCTAYINYEGEDQRYLSEETIQTKIRDWSEAGLDVRPFVVFAVSVLRELLAHYKQPILNILQEAKAISNALDEALDTRNMKMANGQEV